MRTIFNTCFKVTSQKHADMLKQNCIDNNLPYWDYEIAFIFSQGYDSYFGKFGHKAFSVFPSPVDKEIITELEWVELLKQYNNEHKS